MNSHLSRFLIGASAIVCLYAHAQKGSYRIILGKTVDSVSQAVACAHPEAAVIGAQILMDGGNAMDAAIATQWALAVCYPRAGNIGGGGLMTIRLANGETNALDFREVAPAMARSDMYLDRQGIIVPGMSLDTRAAAGIPGSVAGLFAAHEKYASLEMSVLIKPALQLAQKGFAITEAQARLLNDFAPIFAERNNFKTAFQKSKGAWIKGDTLRQPELAKTLQRIAEHGQKDFYTGETAKLLLNEVNFGTKFFVETDLQSYSAKWRDPVVVHFKEYNIICMPPPSSGGVALGQLLTLWEEFGSDTILFNSVSYIHLITEMERRVYADRSEHLGDGDFHDVPMDTLLNETYLKNRLKDFDWYNATPSERINPGKIFAGSEKMETTHTSVVDAKGNAVSVTTTLNGNFGSGIVVEGAGFFLNNEMDDFSSKPGTPNMFGLIGGAANAIEPGKRMLSSMTPTIVEKEEKLFLVLGSPGGATIITSVFQTVLNTTVFQMPLDSAIAAPKFHSQWWPDKIFMEEGRFDQDSMNHLKALGHTIDFYQTLGRVDAIMMNENGTVKACGDPRGDDVAAGIFSK